VPHAAGVDERGAKASVNDHHERDAGLAGRVNALSAADVDRLQRTGDVPQDCRVESVKNRPLSQQPQAVFRSVEPVRIGLHGVPRALASLVPRMTEGCPWL
jgi:hypothetical protein